MLVRPASVPAQQSIVTSAWGQVMREFVFIAGIIGLFIVIALLGRTAGSATAGVTAQVQIGQLEAEAAAARAEANTIREALTKSQEELKKEQGTASALRQKVEALERQAGSKRK
jgi:Skp family chaperone for outer membrane proteins